MNCEDQKHKEMTNAIPRGGLFLLTHNHFMERILPRPNHFTYKFIDSTPSAL